MVVTDIAIVGAGPYGLSIAAHLREQGRKVRIFGQPMQTWLTRMPKGMFLKSEGFASDLYEPTGTFRLADYCAGQGIPYADVGVPTSVETFSSYGLEFQRRFVPNLEQRTVTGISRQKANFELRFEDGPAVSARQVVVAAGITNYDYTPPALDDLSEDYVSHSSMHHRLEQFAGKQVAVIGSGSSAIDMAALLRKVGAMPELVARKLTIGFPGKPPERRSMLERLRAPQTGLGPGWRSRMCTDMPLVFHALPERLRLRVVRRHLGPLPCWFTRDDVMGNVPMHLGFELQGAEIVGNRVRLRLAGAGGRRELEVDHVIAATGYRVNLHRLGFLDQNVRSGIRSAEGAPVLTTNFESTVPGLHFVGASSANSFGPLVRFAFGGRFTARRLARHFRRG